ncbi:hypothetical protein B4N84_12090 [Flavobacterium sp. IR1]|nr:hypothetical protein B4N84_12090 [Flavobacterium sp. IR1]
MKIQNENNFKNKLALVFTIFSVLFLTSCEEVVHLDLEAAPSKLIVDAEILWNKGTSGNEQIIKISKMASYYDTATPKVSGAKVYIENSTGTSFTFTESEPGSYVCTNFVPELNMDYTLYIEAEGKSFTATEKLAPVVPITKIDQKYVTDSDGIDLLELDVYYDDPDDETNYYLTEFRTDFLLFPSYSMTSDEFFNGNEIKTTFSDDDLKSGKNIEIIHRGISKSFLNYMTLIFQASGWNPFAIPPGNIRGNIVNTTDSNDFALGYFRLCEATHASYIMK